MQYIVCIYIERERCTYEANLSICLIQNQGVLVLLTWQATNQALVGLSSDCLLKHVETLVL